MNKIIGLSFCITLSSIVASLLSSSGIEAVNKVLIIAGIINVVFHMVTEGKKLKKVLSYIPKLLLYILCLIAFVFSNLEDY